MKREEVSSFTSVLTVLDNLKIVTWLIFKIFLGIKTVVLHIMESGCRLVYHIRQKRWVIISKFARGLLFELFLRIKTVVFHIME